MIPRSLLTLALSVLGSTAALHLPAQPPAARPAPTAADTARHGTYDLEFITDGGTFVGRLAVTRVPNGRAAQLSIMDHSPTTRRFVRTDSGYALDVEMGDTKVAYTLVFVADTVRGRYTMSTGDSGRVSGTRRR